MEPKKTSTTLKVITILLLIFFFPIGLILMWLKTQWPKPVKWGITALFAFLVIISIVGSNGSSKNNTQVNSQAISPTLTLAPTATPTPAKPMTLEEKIKAKLPDDLRSITTIEIDNAVDFKTNADVPGKKDVTLTLTYGDAFWDLNAAKKSTWGNAATIMKALFPTDNTIDGIIIINQIPSTTAYGKKGNSMLDTISLTRNTYNKIDFANFDSNNIPTIADSYVENHNLK